MRYATSSTDSTKKGAKNAVAIQVLQAAKDGIVPLPEVPKRAAKRPAPEDGDNAGEPPAKVWL